MSMSDPGDDREHDREHDRDHDRPRAVDLSELAPRATWVSRLEEAGLQAAHRRAQGATWADGVSRSARWFIPAAAVLASACWWLTARHLARADALPPPAALAAGSEREQREVMLAVTLGEQP